MPMTKARSAEARRRSSWTPASVESDYNGTLIFAKPTLEHFVEFAKKLRLDNGKPFIVEDWQREVLADYFDGVFETLLLLPSGNGKTTLYAAIVLHHLLYTDAPEAFIVASARDQAARLHKHIAGFVHRSKALGKLVRVLRRSIELRHREGSVEVLSADAGTADGVGGTLTILDELHRWKSRDIYVVAVKGCKKRLGRLLGCSTAGETMQSLLGEIRQRGLELPNLTRVGMKMYARAEDDSLAFHEYSLAEEDDSEDLETVKLANPLESITVKSLKLERTTMTWWEWARFACGLWVAGEHAAISPLDWAACNYDDVEFDNGTREFLAADLAWVGDTTAITAVQALNRLDVRAKKIAIVEPAGDGTVLREAQILGPVDEYVRTHPLCRDIVIDPEAGGRSLIEKFEALGLTVHEHSQKNPPMCDAFGQLHSAIGRRFDEDDEKSPRVLQVKRDRQLTAHVLAAAAEQHTGLGSKLVKRKKNPEPIDGAVSLAMGVRVALAELDAEPPVDRSLYRMEFV